MRCMFYNNYALQSIESIKNWNVSKVMDYSYMFASNSSLENATPIKVQSQDKKSIPQLSN